MSGVETLIAVGRIVRPHGICGEVKVASLSDWPELFEQYRSLYIEKEGGEGKWIGVERGRTRGNQIILKLSGINNRNGAESLRGALLKVGRDDCLPIPEDTYYVFDIVGLSVRTTQGEIIGSVVDVLKMPAQDLYVVDNGEKEVLIPAVKAFIKKVDIQEGQIVIEPIEGLLD